MSELSTQVIQQRIDEIQVIYRQWLQLQPQLEAAQQDWQRSEQLMRQLIDFYDKEYIEYVELHNQGLPVSLQTSGEQSVLSEDAIFEAIGERHQLAMSWLKNAVRALDNDENAV